MYVKISACVFPSKPSSSREVQSEINRGIKSGCSCSEQLYPGVSVFARPPKPLPLRSDVSTIVSWGVPNKRGAPGFGRLLIGAHFTCSFSGTGLRRGSTVVGARNHYVLLRLDLSALRLPPAGDGLGRYAL